MIYKSCFSSYSTKKQRVRVFAASGSLTGSDGSHQGQQGDGPRVVPRSDDQHHAEGLGLDVHLVWEGEEGLLHRPGSRPLGQLLYGQLDLILYADELQEGRVILALAQRSTWTTTGIKVSYTCVVNFIQRTTITLVMYVMETDEPTKFIFYCCTSFTALSINEVFIGFSALIVQMSTLWD